MYLDTIIFARSLFGFTEVGPPPQHHGSIASSVMEIWGADTNLCPDIDFIVQIPPWCEPLLRIPTLRWVLRHHPCYFPRFLNSTSCPTIAWCRIPLHFPPEYILFVDLRTISSPPVIYYLGGCGRDNIVRCIDMYPLMYVPILYLRVQTVAFKIGLR